MFPPCLPCIPWFKSLDIQTTEHTEDTEGTRNWARYGSELSFSTDLIFEWLDKVKITTGAFDDKRVGVVLIIAEAKRLMIKKVEIHSPACFFVDL